MNYQTGMYVEIEKDSGAKDLTDEKIGAYCTLYKVLTTLIKIAAPFVPFMTDEIYQNLVVGLDKDAPESVHLCLWPEVEEDKNRP